MKTIEKISLFTEVTTEESATVRGGKRVRVSYNPATGSMSLTEVTGGRNTTPSNPYLSVPGLDVDPYNNVSSIDDFTIEIDV